ncbi:MAG: peptide ABC transporter ATP-binding protein, partial [Gammaproteobacteria bacterium]|nr:peptide ABC transporter ATP-binding protein [Gammaproteobacteria bacterium]
IVEIVSIEDIFLRPQHPYTQGLLRATPRIDADPDVAIDVIPGRPPDLVNLPSGCAFADRCAQAIPRCREIRPELKTRFDSHKAACLVDQPR